MPAISSPAGAILNDALDRRPAQRSRSPAGQGDDRRRPTRCSSSPPAASPMILTSAATRCTAATASMKIASQVRRDLGFPRAHQRHLRRAPHPRQSDAQDGQRARSTPVVSKSRFTMDIYLGSPGETGSMYVRSFPVGLGKHGSTPTGTWMVAPQSKLKNPKWWGTADEPATRSGRPAEPPGQVLDRPARHRWRRRRQGGLRHPRHDRPRQHRQRNEPRLHPPGERECREQVYEMLVDGKSTIIVKD